MELQEMFFSISVFIQIAHLHLKKDHSYCERCHSLTEFVTQLIRDVDLY